MVCLVNFMNRIETRFRMHDYELRVNNKVINLFGPSTKEIGVTELEQSLLHRYPR
jgi:hypothetical protein